MNSSSRSSVNIIWCYSKTYENNHISDFKKAKPFFNESIRPWPGWHRCVCRWTHVARIWAWGIRFHSRRRLAFSDSKPWSLFEDTLAYKILQIEKSIGCMSVEYDDHCCDEMRIEFCQNVRNVHALLPNILCNNGTNAFFWNLSEVNILIHFDVLFDKYQ